MTTDNTSWDARLLSRFRRYVDIVAVSGYEDCLIAEIVAELQQKFTDITVDGLGNVTLTVPGRSKFHLMLVTHMDEVGFVVKGIDPSGFLFIQQLTGFIERTLPGMEMVIAGDQGLVSGVIGSRGDHLLGPHERFAMPPVSDLYIDVGARSVEEVTARGIDIGSPVATASSFNWLLGTRFHSRAIDDRIGVAMLMQLAELIGEGSLIPPVTMTLAFTVQEEVGMRGARSLAQHCSPDLVIAVDSSLATDVPDTNHTDGDLVLGSGATIKVVDAQRTSIEGIIVNPKLVKALIQTANRHHVSVQKEVITGLTTDVSLLQYGRAIAGGVGIPLRNGHSAHEIADWIDVQSCFSLLLHLISEGDSFDYRRF